MADLDKLSTKIFSLLKGNGLKIKIYDIDGNEIVDPSFGRRFFITNPNIMITIDEDPRLLTFTTSGKNAGEDPVVKKLWTNVDRTAKTHSPIMDTRLEASGKNFTPRDHSFKAKINRNNMMENNSVKPRNHFLLGKILHKVRFFGGASAHTLADDLGLPLSDIQPILNKLVTDGKIVANPTPHGEIEYNAAVDEAVMETSTEKLAKYKTAAAADAKKADASGDTKRADKRFSGIVKATKKQFDNDAKQSETVKESFSKMFGSLKTSRQVLENVRILVKHSSPVSEEVRGSRSRHINAIFLECNGERMRFPYNYLPGARAMAQHMAHGGVMSDKVGTYIAESTGQLLKLQSFNRYVTTNKLINEDSSGIVETIKENIDTIRTELKKLTGTKTYETVKARIETFEREQLSEDDVSQLKDLFTIRRFDEKFEEVLPIVKQLVQEKDTYHKRIEEAAANSIILRREAISAVPMMEFASDNARLGYRINELALRITENDELAGFVNKIGNKLCKEGTINEFEKAILTQVFENSKVEEKNTSKKEITESYDLEAFFDRYTMNFF